MRLSQSLFCMTGCCFSLIEQDVSVLFCQAVSVVGSGCSPKPAVDVLSLFPHFFVLDSMEWARTIYFAVLFPHCSSDVCFFCFVVCFGHHVVLYFVCRCMRPAERRSSLRGWAFFFLGLSYPGFFFFCMKIFYICISLFLLFISFFFSFHCFSYLLVLSICLDGSSLSFRFFFLFALFHLCLLLLFSQYYIFI